MDILCDDILNEILKLTSSCDIIKFSITNRHNKEYFDRNIKNFSFKFENINDEGLKYFSVAAREVGTTPQGKGAHIIDLSGCREVTDRGFQVVALQLPGA